MTTVVQIVNRALQQAGTRTTVTTAELENETTNEAVQVNLVLQNIRQDLLRMAPWNFAMKTRNLTYITSTPGTPENPNAAQTTLWQPGQPSPPWAYEYQYPVDCQRACWIIPAMQTGYQGIPITTAVTGGAPSTWLGGPIRFKVASDEFYPVTAAAVAAGGTGYAVGDEITLAETPEGEDPIGAPVVLRVLTAPAGVVATVEVVAQIEGSSPAQGGSYFATQTNPVEQSSTTGSGSGATFNLTFGSKGTQRVILTNQEYATLVYVKDITDPNVMDTMFQSAWSNLLGATVAMALTGDKDLANRLIVNANDTIEKARTPDGNEGLTINDVTPDWIRIRGVVWNQGFSGPYGDNYDWGATWPLF